MIAQDYRKTKETHQIGLSTDKPNAVDVLTGTLYFSTDTNILERSDGIVWELYSSSDTIGTGNVTGPLSSVVDRVATYASTTGKVIKDSGILSTDIARKSVTNTFNAGQEIAAASPTIWLRETDQPADQRLWSFTSLDQTFQIWPLTDVGEQINTGLALNRAGNISVAGTVLAAGLSTTPLNASQLTSGTVDNNRLSTNVAKKDSNNNFTAPQTINGALTATGLISGSVDATFGAAVRAGTGLYERGRTPAVGEWINVPFNAANFTTPTAGATFVVTGANYFYTLVGKTVCLSLVIGGGQATITGAPVRFHITLPIASNQSHGVPFSYYASGHGTGICFTSGTVLDLLRDVTGLTYPAGAVSLALQIMYSIA